jgi:hypothetical protein
VSQTPEIAGIERAAAPSRVLHAIVGHKLPVYFLNAVNSVRLMAENDDILVVDNASGMPGLIQELQSIAERAPRVSLLLRATNDISRNSKVGGLYDAYNEVIDYALERGYDFLHIIQHDMQMVWWDDTVLARAEEIFAEYPECVNISMIAQSRDLKLSDGLSYVKPKLVQLSYYGLTDTGLYDLAKWRARGMRFGESEQAHAQQYRAEGLRVLCHPLPTIAFVPWPAVVRSGKVVGREVKPVEQFLLRPLTDGEIGQVKESTEPVWLEQLAIPWGWSCLMPYWPTDLWTITYWVYRYRETRARGLRAAWPRWQRAGLPSGASLRGVQRAPRFGVWQVLASPAWHGLRRALRRR